MEKDIEKKRFSISKKLRIFVAITVFIVSVAIAILSYCINVAQIDIYFKRIAFDSAKNFASFVDYGSVSRLRAVAESKEFQRVRDKAESDKDERAIEDYLKEKEVWEDYCKTKEVMCKYLNNMEDIKYLYIMVLGDRFAFKDMYLVDDYDNPLYRTGQYEDREPELKGVDTSQKIEPFVMYTFPRCKYLAGAAPYMLVYFCNHAASFKKRYKHCRGHKAVFRVYPSCKGLCTHNSTVSVCNWLKIWFNLHLVFNIK